MHVPKTAGTSLRKLFAHEAGPNGIAYVYLAPFGDDLHLSDLYGWPSHRVDALKVIFGHYPFGIDRELGRPGIYLTCLRETASRLASCYFQHVRGGFVGESSLLDYIENWKPLDFDNYTVRLLSGVGHDVPFGMLTMDHLRQAQHNLVNGFDAFGLFEELQRSVGLFCEKTGMAPVELARENAAAPDQIAEQLSADELSTVVRRNNFDDELYALAKSEFRRRWG